MLNWLLSMTRFFSPPPPLRVLAIGTSNMLGRGSGLPDSFANLSQNVRAWNTDNTRQPTSYSNQSPGTQFVIPAIGQRPFSIDRISYNLAEEFCHQATKHFARVNLVLVTNGGTDITQWDAPGDLCYDRIAQVWNAAKPKNGNGPADVFMTSITNPNVPEYADLYRAMVANLKSIGILSDVTKKLVVGAADADEWAQSVQKPLATSLGNGIFVDASGLEVQDANNHWTNASLQEVGRRAYTVWRSIT